MPSADAQWGDFSGDYEDLVGAARAVMAITHDPRRAAPARRAAYEKAGRINERLVRQYVAAGAVSPGERQGRAVRFGFRQLLQLVVARHLMAVDRWKLPQIAALMRTASAAELRDLLPSQAAGALSSDRDWPGEAAAIREPPLMSAAAAAPATSPTIRHARLDSLADESRRAAGFARERERLQEPSLAPETTQWIRFTLTPWTEVHVREDALEAWDDDLVQTLAEHLKVMLRRAAARRRR